MATDVAVVIPWRPGDNDRERAMQYLLPRLADLGDIRVGLCTMPVWCKAEAVANAIGETDAEVLVVHDADVWCDGTRASIDAVRDGAPWAVPHLNVYRLDADSTAATIEGGPLGVLHDHRLAERPYRGHLGGGIVVVRREVYEDCPLDPRFVGWGHEDDSWALALTCLHGPPQRGKRALWHLWHEPQDRVTRRIGSVEGRDLHRRYTAAKRSPDAMRALLDESRVAA